MSARLATGVWVAAYLARLRMAGMAAYVVAKGDATAGAVVVKVVLPGGRGKPVTREAHLAQLVERFRRQDVDRDGFLNAKELAAPPQ